MKNITIIGCGKVGRTLAYLWNQNKIFAIGQILNRSRESAQNAVEFIGAGCAISSFEELEPADAFLIAASDNHIETCGALLARSRVITPGAAVFHCSGSLSSEILAPVKEQGARILSVHPVKSFADPSSAIQTFAGTFCGFEGETEENDFVLQAFVAIGAPLFRLDAKNKTLYHAATVFACNYLTALMEVGIKCFEQSGVTRSQAMDILGPITKGTLENIFHHGTAKALTGPIARGDDQVVARQCQALDQWDAPLGQLYRLLGMQALDLASQQGNASAEALAQIHDILNPSPTTPNLRTK